MSKRSGKLGLALPLATLALAVWQALPSLLDGWNHDLYSRGAPFAFAIWLAPQGYLFVKYQNYRGNPAVFWIAISLFLTAAGSLSELSILKHFGLAAAVPAVCGLKRSGLVAMAAAPGWLPATGWFISRYQTGGMDGWERPIFATLMSVILVTLSRLSQKPNQVYYRNS